MSFLDMFRKNNNEKEADNSQSIADLLDTKGFATLLAENDIETDNDKVPDIHRAFTKLEANKDDVSAVFSKCFKGHFKNIEGLNDDGVKDKLKEYLDKQCVENPIEVINITESVAQVKQNQETIVELEAKIGELNPGALDEERQRLMKQYKLFSKATNPFSWFGRKNEAIEALKRANLIANKDGAEQIKVKLHRLKKELYGDGSPSNEGLEGKMRKLIIAEDDLKAAKNSLDDLQRSASKRLFRTSAIQGAMVGMAVGMLDDAMRDKVASPDEKLSELPISNFISKLNELKDAEGNPLIKEEVISKVREKIDKFLNSLFDDKLKNSLEEINPDTDKPYTKVLNLVKKYREMSKVLSFGGNVDTPKIVEEKLKAYLAGLKAEQAPNKTLILLLTKATQS